VVDRARNALSNPEMADFCDFQDRQWGDRLDLRVGPQDCPSFSPDKANSAIHFHPCPGVYWQASYID
jgi:hypothetical protein